jgi:plastocyanin
LKIATVRRLVILCLAFVAVFAFAQPAYTATGRVRAVGSSPTGSDPFRWRPSSKHIPPGDKIVWKNTTNSTHHVSAYGGNWSFQKTVPAGERVGKRFRNEGTYKYRCDIPGHSTLSPSGTCNGMCGEIHVAR